MQNINHFDINDNFQSIDLVIVPLYRPSQSNTSCRYKNYYNVLIFRTNLAEAVLVL